ncbi:small acid-soluble spore protein Tlp [Rummeliibacillus pycnus]|uniref:small acid-soluble spore protein Tlp n=1 Tax=Rummeliibacillus pycnus TaxID=101070 RepID=UPI000C9BCE44|nr:small acid-soluble spore protein Tlp [Rummeliibacillus pycnus]
MSNQNTPKPDDRSDNVERLQEMAKHTKKNIKEAEISMEFAGPDEARKIKEKNERREKALDAFIAEMKDEAEARKKGLK